MAAIRWENIIENASGPYIWGKRCCTTLASDIVELFTGRRPIIYTEAHAMPQFAATRCFVRAYGTLGNAHDAALVTTPGVKRAPPDERAAGRLLWASEGYVTIGRTGAKWRLDGPLGVRSLLLAVLPDGFVYACQGHGLVAVGLEGAHITRAWKCAQVVQKRARTAPAPGRRITQRTESNPHTGVGGA